MNIPMEGDLLEPCWDNEEAVNEYLERGRVVVDECEHMIANMRITRKGVVTRVDLDKILIDRQVQFNFASKNMDLGVSDLKIGDHVQYWLENGKCIQIAPIRHDSEMDEEEEFWGDGNSSKKKKQTDVVKMGVSNDKLRTINGRITDLRKCNGFPCDVEVITEISNEGKKQPLSFMLSAVGIGGPVSKGGTDGSTAVFIPTVGDWVKLALVKVTESNSDCKVVALEPLRWRNFEGEVTRVSKTFDSRLKTSCEFAIIECEIYVPLRSCINGYYPVRSDWVGGLAFECSASEGCCWRAVNVFPRPQSSLKPRTIKTQESDQMQSSKDLGSPDDEELAKSIEINGDIHFGQIQINETKQDIISLTNNGDKLEVIGEIQIGAIKHNSAWEGYCFSIPDPDLPVAVKPGQRVDFIVEAKPVQVGIENTRILFLFGKKQRQISTYVEAEGVTEELLNLASRGSNQPRNRSTSSVPKSFRSESQVLVPAERPVFSKKPRETFVQRLGHYTIPPRLTNILDDQGDVVSICPFLAEAVSMDNYTKRFSTLLHMEEFAVQCELDRYSLHRVFFSVVSANQMGLKVPGLQEQRPSLLIGDMVVASDPSPTSNSPSYEGFICEVQIERVLIMFSQAFHSKYDGEDYNVSFKSSRTVFRRAHQAAELAHQRLGQRVLFPLLQDVNGHNLKEDQTRVATRTHKIERTNRNKENIDPRLYVPRLDLTFFNSLLNERQRVAVLRIVEGRARPIPYILYGPPGTGKTVTLVEVLLQLYHLLPDSRILACAPSNSAADLLCIRVHELNESCRGEDDPALDMVRLNAYQRKDIGMEDEIIQRYHKSLDDIGVAVKSRLLVATCTTAGQMYKENVRAGSFTHVIIDEAGHATEPEALIAVNFADYRNGQIVLAGDPKQLGPVLESRLSNSFGLQVSLLERLSQLLVYARDEGRFSRLGAAGGYNPLVATKLINNYRSHPCLFKVSSRAFYDDELVANAPEDVQNLFLSPNNTLPNPKLPLIFHCVQGRDLREGESLSWFNSHEVIVVISYLKKLLVDGFDGKIASVQEIGVITPYRKQIEMIRMFIERASLPQVKVGTVEEFQGQERSIMLLSVVRSTETANVKQALGFLANPKRMNVALTRAKSLLIVAANPFVLLSDPYWGDFTKFCFENNCCIGSSDVLAKIGNKSAPKA